LAHGLYAVNVNFFSQKLSTFLEAYFTY